MFERSIVSWLAVLLVLGVVVTLDADGSAAMAQPPGQQPLGAAPPGTHGVPGTPRVLRPDEIEKLISPEEREKLGLPEPRWVARFGKVHPDVRAILETGQMPWVRYKGWAVIGFEGTAYVAVHLRHEQRGKATSPENRAAVKDVQKRVLSRLTAGEFHTWYMFENVPAILGFVNPAGLAKLAKDADVIAVGLDDNAVPEQPGRLTVEDLPPAKAGDPATQPAQGRFLGSGGKVQADVYRALALHGRVFVIVGLRDRQVEEVEEHLEKEIGKGRAIEERLLASLSADQFWLGNKTPKGGSSILAVAGFVNLEGLKVLDSHPDVEAVCLSRRAKGWPANAGP